MSINYFECLKLLVSMYMCMCNPPGPQTLDGFVVTSCFECVPASSEWQKLFSRQSRAIWRRLLARDDMCRKPARVFYPDRLPQSKQVYPLLFCPSFFRCQWYLSQGTLLWSRIQTFAHSKQTQSPASKVACSWRLQSKSPIGRSTAQ